MWTSDVCLDRRIGLLDSGPTVLAAALQSDAGRVGTATEGVGLAAVGNIHSRNRFACVMSRP